MKDEIKSILGKHKVIGDTTYGLGYAEAEQLTNEIIAQFSKRIDTVYQKRKGELEKVGFHCESRAFVVAGLDLLYNFGKEIIGNSNPRCRKCGERTIEWFREQRHAGFHCSSCGEDVSE